MARRAKRRRWDWEFTPAENRRRAEAKANYKSMAARPFGESTMKIDPTISQAEWFFVYVLLPEDGVPNTHVVTGFDRASLDQTRQLVQSGSHIDRLLYLSDVTVLESHHRRRVKDLVNPDESTLACAAAGEGEEVSIELGIVTNKEPQVTGTPPPETLSIKPLVECKNIAEYFVSSLGVPNPPGRIEELREDYPNESEVAKLCRDAIDAARTLTSHIKQTVGLGDNSEHVRQVALLVCEVYAFG